MSESKINASTKNLRIDYSKYQIDEVVETIADAIFFPLYIGKVAFSVVITGLLLIIGLAYFITSHWTLTILFALLTFIITSPSLILISIIRIINTIVSDINNVVSISIETTKHVYEDSGLIKQQRASNIPLKSSFSDVFRGVSLYVIRPSLKKVVSKKLGRLAFVFTFIIDKLFKYIIVKKQPQFDVEITEDKTGKHLEINTTSLDSKLISGTEKTMSISGKVIKFPFYLALSIYGVINLILIWLLTLIF